MLHEVSDESQQPSTTTTAAADAAVAPKRTSKKTTSRMANSPTARAEIPVVSSCEGGQSRAAADVRNIRVDPLPPPLPANYASIVATFRPSRQLVASLYCCECGLVMVSVAFVCLFFQAVTSEKTNVVSMHTHLRDIQVM